MPDFMAQMCPIRKAMLQRSIQKAVRFRNSNG